MISDDDYLLMIFIIFVRSLPNAPQYSWHHIPRDIYNLRLLLCQVPVADAFISLAHICLLAHFWGDALARARGDFVDKYFYKLQEMLSLYASSTHYESITDMMIHADDYASPIYTAFYYWPDYFSLMMSSDS